MKCVKYYNIKDVLKALKQIGGTLWYDEKERAYYIM